MHEVGKYAFWRTFTAKVSNPVPVGFHSKKAGATPGQLKIKMTKQVEQVTLCGLLTTVPPHDPHCAQNSAFLPFSSARVPTLVLAYPVLDMLLFSLLPTNTIPLNNQLIN